MTTDLERQFFDTFGIEPRHKCTDGALEPCDEQCNYCGYYELRYPQITDRILLELICIHNTYLETYFYGLEYESLRKEILKDLINEQESRELETYYVSDDMKHQVQALFKEG